MIAVDYEEFTRANVHPVTGDVEFEFTTSQEAVLITASAYQFSEMLKYMADTQRALLRQSSPVGSPIAATPAVNASAEHHKRTGNVLLLLTPDDAPVEGYSLHPKIARKLGERLIEASDAAEQAGPPPQPN